MGTTADKLARLDESKALLKTRLTEKGLDAASEDNFYNLANMVGDLPSPAKKIKVTLVYSSYNGVKEVFYTDAIPPTPFATKSYFYDSKPLEVETFVGSIFLIAGKSYPSIVSGSYVPLGSDYAFGITAFYCSEDTTIEFS